MSAAGVEVKSGYVAFKPRARLLKLIGAELISDDVVAVTELVKNAYDADASRVTIRFESVSDVGGTITVSDDGHGMDREILLGGWMEPASSTKRGLHRKLSPKGRWMLGEKGLGRFAADKLGKSLELVSRRTGSAGEVCAQFNWDQFEDEGAMLGEVKNRWEIRPAKEVEKQGTILKVSGLRAPWTERMFRRLSTRLARLRSPFQSVNGFTIAIESNEFPEYSRELSSGFLEASPYKLDATFDGHDSLRVRLNGTAPITTAWTGTPLACGPMRVRLHAFDLETEAIAKLGPRSEVKAWIREWCGVSIYRDNFRVWPYGEPHDDWLRLDQRRVNNPVVCLSNNQVVGFIEISQKENSELKDQTNREGLFNNAALDDLRRLMHFIFQLLESARQSVRHPDGRDRREARASLQQRGPEADPDLVKLRELAGTVGGKVGAEIRGVASRLEEDRIRRETDQRGQIEQYALLAARGHTIAGLTSGIDGLISKVGTGVHAFRSGMAKQSDFGIDDLLEMEASVKGLDSRLRLIAALTEGGAGRRRSIEVPVELQRLRELYDHEFKSRKARMKLSSPNGELLRVEMSPESLRLLFHLLIENSFDWAGSAEPVISLAVTGDEDSVEIEYSDTGKGIAPGLAEQVFEPTFSLKEGGQGLGLTIARNLVTSHGGTIHVQVDGRRKRGALFVVRLPRKRSRATREIGKPGTQLRLD